MLIGLSGRKGCGKSTIADLLCGKYDFQRASFATTLKESVAWLYGWALDTLNSQFGKEEILESPVEWNENTRQQLSDYLKCDLPLIENKNLHSRRDVLRWIGTDVLRTYDPEFHIKEFKKRYSDGNYVCDDLRFVNELDSLKDMKATCIYITRPYHWQYSNHASETSLNRTHFKYCFLNDGSEHKLIRKFSMFFGTLLLKKQPAVDRSDFFSLLERHNYNTTKCASEWKCSRDKIVWWATKHMFPISNNTYDLNHDAFLYPTEESAYWAGLFAADGTIKKHLKYDYLVELTSDDKELIIGFKEFLKSTSPIYSLARQNGNTRHTLCISSPYIIEDLKRWNIEPRKSKKLQLPDIIKNNKDLMASWLVGLIDGDGTIYPIKPSNIGITILASPSVITYVKEMFNFGGSVCGEKGIEGLMNLKTTGRAAVDLYKKIYKGKGLNRKWSKVKPFIDKIWHH